MVIINHKQFGGDMNFYTKAVLLTLIILASQIFAGLTTNNLVYIHPKPDAKFVSPQTQLIFKVPVEKSNLLSKNTFRITVTGEKSGNNEGKIIISGNTLIFKPFNNFVPDEVVSVTVNNMHYTFTTNSVQPFDNRIYNLVSDERKYEQEIIKTAAQPELTGKPQIINGVAVPSDFPVFTPAINLPGQAPGKIFLNNWGGAPYIMILNPDGSPYAFKKVEERARDFKVQPNGMLTRRIISNLYAFVGMDSSLTITDTFKCANGYGTDEHELFMTENGHYFLIALGYRNVDMSKLIAGGKTNVEIVDNHVQEFDENKNLVFEWLSSDNFNIVDAVHENLYGTYIDYVHMNSVATDYDGNIITSSRHLSEVTKIDRQTGEMIWRFGGENNQFMLVNDDYGISYQHCIRAVPGVPGNYTIFDNGNYHSPSFSRAVEFKLDTANMTATKVWEYRHTPERYTFWMGNTKRLPNGNTFLNYSDQTLPKYVEVTPEGNVVYEGDFNDSYHCYRSFKFEWDYLDPFPSLMVESHPDKVTLLCNKFGDSNVSKWLVYAAKSGQGYTIIDTATENIINLTDLSNGSLYYFRIIAVDENGNQSPLSNTVSAVVNFIGPGENIITNGTFSNGTNNWEFSTYNNGSATSYVNGNGEYEISITNGGSNVWDVQLLQKGLQLIKGYTYRLEYDARAAHNRAVTIKLERSSDPWDDYSEIGQTLVKTYTQHFSYEFTMNYDTDYDARLSINAGGFAHDLYLDNFSVVLVATDVNEELEVIPSDYSLSQNYPNPFNPETTIEFSIPRREHTVLRMYNIKGELVKTLIDNTLNAGRYNYKLNGNYLASGVYFYQLFSGNRSITRKMILLK